ncbi:ATP-grasp domain-containing protein [Methanocaldococcus sp.]
MRALVLGVNTRPLANSLKRAGFYVTSISYYAPEDLIADKAYYFINKDNHGRFKENYREELLTKKANEIYDQFDYVFICSGVFENKDSKVYDWHNVYGNPPKKIKEISYKPKTYRRLENLGYNVPVSKVAKSYRDIEKFLDEFKKIVLKPLSGSGGFIRKITSLDNLKNVEFPILLQQFIEGKSFSTNFIDNIFITYNKQIIINGLYSGNITPYKFNDKLLTNSFLEIIEAFELQGMNGIDFILSNGEIYILDVNPRILGTFETIELSSKTNLAKAMIYNKEVKLKERMIKRIVFSKNRVRAKIKKSPFIFDIPKEGAIIEKNEPLVTVIAKRNLKSIIERVYKWCI